MIGMPGIKGDRGYPGAECAKGIQGPKGVPGLRGEPGKHINNLYFIRYNEVCTKIFDETQ